MKLSSLIGVLLLLGFCAGTVLAAPGGDQDAKPWSYGFAPRATYPEVEPNDVCPGQSMACGDMISPASYSVATDDDWYVFNVAAAGTWLTIGTQALPGSPDVDTYLQLYDSCTGSYIAYDDDGGPSAFSLISNFVAPHAGDYYVKTYTYGHYYTGDYELFVNCTEPVPPPENDTCDGAIAIDRCTEGVIAGDLTLAVNNYDPSIPGPSCTGYGATGNDVTYVMTLVAGDMVHLFYYGGYDESIYIVTDCSDMTTCVEGADGTVGTGETIDWTATADGTYYIICDKYGTGGAAFSLTYEITCPVDTYVCCVGHDCYLFETEQECTDMQGQWHPEWTSCGNDPCDIYTPADPNSWGQIKNAYR